jgi:hypothetical protein
LGLGSSGAESLPVFVFSSERSTTSIGAAEVAEEGLCGACEGAGDVWFTGGVSLDTGRTGVDPPVTVPVAVMVFALRGGGRAPFAFGPVTA